MLGYTIRRILWVFPVLWVIATITFLLMQAVPGGPFTQDRARQPAAERALQAKYGLDDPLPVQYGRYLSNLARGDLGISFRSGDRPVMDLLRPKIFTTAQIAIICLVIAVAAGMTLGTLSALNHNGPLDYIGVVFATIGASVPHFVLAIFLVIVFSNELGWFKQMGWGGPENAGELLQPSAYEWKRMFFPVAALSMLPTSYIARVTRASMLEVLNQDYIRTARAKGLRETRVVTRHALKNSLIPVITVIGPIAAVLASGSFIIERMFNVNGIGAEFIKAVFARDYGMIMALSMFFALVVAIANLIVDLLYAAVDPRIRYR